MPEPEGPGVPRRAAEQAHPATIRGPRGRDRRRMLAAWRVDRGRSRRTAPPAPMSAFGTGLAAGLRYDTEAWIACMHSDEWKEKLRGFTGGERKA